MKINKKNTVNFKNYIIVFIMKPKSIFLNPTPQPIEIPVSILKNLFTGKKHIVILSSPSLKHTNVLLGAIRGGLDIEVNKVFPFTQYKEAYQYAEKGGYIGKVIVEINSEHNNQKDDN